MLSSDSGSTSSSDSGGSSDHMSAIMNDSKEYAQNGLNAPPNGTYQILYSTKIYFRNKKNFVNR